MKQYHGNGMTWWECDCGYAEGLEGKSFEQERHLQELADDIHGYGRDPEELDEDVTGGSDQMF
ncbi:MAG: hypothetical protein R6U52_00550 [Kosmotogaceae bacterium]